MVYRSRDQIVAEILRVANEKKGIKKTSIMQKTSLNFYQVNRYLEAIVGAGFIDKDENPDYWKKPLQRIKALYKTNKKGIDLLEALDESRAGMEEIKKLF